MTSGFRIFGTAHLTALAVVAAAAFGLGSWARGRSQPRTRIALGTALVALEVIYFLGEARAGALTRHAAPLHLCDIAVFAALAALWLRSWFGYELLYFWACAGTSLALITPDLREGFPSREFLCYFALHGAVVVTAVVATMALGHRPRKGAAWRAFLATNVYAAAIALVNEVWGTNFLYLSHKPPSPTLLDWFGPWPVYIVAGEAVAAGLFWILYLPFRVRARE